MSMPRRQRVLLTRMREARSAIGPATPRSAAERNITAANRAAVALASATKKTYLTARGADFFRSAKVIWPLNGSPCISFHFFF